jgi:hypothetical protein
MDDGRFNDLYFNKLWDAACVGHPLTSDPEVLAELKRKCRVELHERLLAMETNGEIENWGNGNKTNNLK